MHCRMGQLEILLGKLTSRRSTCKFLGAWSHIRNANAGVRIDCTYSIPVLRMALGSI
jgi:hypothetical protein